MKYERIWVGKEINTPEGYAIIKGYNGSIVYLDEYIIDYEGNEQKEGEHCLTLAEIGHMMQETDKDGQTYKASFQKSDYMSYTDSDFEDVLKGEYKIFCSVYDDATIENFIYYMGYAGWMEEYIVDKGLGELDETSDIQIRAIDEYIKEVLR